MLTETTAAAPKFGFTVDEIDDLIVFASAQAINEASPCEQVEPLWSYQFDMPAHRYTLGGWLAERRHLWDDWGHIAETEGLEALDEWICALLRASPPAELADVVMRKGAGDRDIQIDVISGRGKAVPIVTHGFRSGRARARFVRRFGKQSTQLWDLWDFVEAGWFGGPRFLHVYLDVLARVPEPGYG